MALQVYTFIFSYYQYPLLFFGYFLPEYIKDYFVYTEVGVATILWGRREKFLALWFVLKQARPFLAWLPGRSF